MLKYQVTLPEPDDLVPELPTKAVLTATVNQVIKLLSEFAQRLEATQKEKIISMVSRNTPGIFVEIDLPNHGSGIEIMLMDKDMNVNNSVIQVIGVLNAKVV